ncbi:polymorphic toxin type 44 domain-containing protein [Mucispirillum schaedleri]|uniref:polymorphic toxin type 44 domain-containing protein n=1 Tax=Mucispirillum schaedleri TaxID=248039 RepID=UPI001F59319D|nr:polymorphic toxin type 44 domain-containing protein [Mucispirillum schaedleri]
MQGKEYEVLSDKSSGEFTVDVRLSILDEALNEEYINDRLYYMYVNKTGEIFESKISNGRSLYVINVENEAEYLYNKDPELCLKGNPKDDNIRKLYTFGIKIEADNYDNNFNHFSYGIAGLKWLKINITTALKVKETDDNKKEKELSLKEACKEIIDKYKNNPLDIDFASFSTDKIEVTGNVSIIAASNSEVKKACDLKEYRYQGSIVYNKDKNIYYYVLNNSEQECAVILCPFIERAVLEQGKYIQLGFDAVDVANYMAGEIENNLLHLQCSDYVLTYWKVDTDNCWDHKWQLSALFPSMGLSRRYHHVYRDKEIPYDVWANIHFGVIGSKINPSDFILLKGAGTEQVISDIKKYKNNINIKDTTIRLLEMSGDYGDNEGDIEAIKIGIQVSKNYEIKTVDIIANQILIILQTYSRTQRR